MQHGVKYLGTGPGARGNSPAGTPPAMTTPAIANETTVNSPVIQPAVRSYRYSPPRGGELRQFVTAGSMSSGTRWRICRIFQRSSVELKAVVCDTVSQCRPDSGGRGDGRGRLVFGGWVYRLVRCGGLYRPVRGCLVRSLDGLAALACQPVVLV